MPGPIEKIESSSHKIRANFNKDKGKIIIDDKISPSALDFMAQIVLKELPKKPLFRCAVMPGHYGVAILLTYFPEK